ncbi:cyclin-dependent kinase 4 inhibitor C isoform X2 [Sphaeramia orbicularis]|uniref:Peptidase A2 domain-containing protein n=1 Tax=Sphaeramia orbicularis TaxID=375764 RepID=A0A673AD92_9TELE|nr:cyclin-dependent kinase 4 inhibitor C isoform X2 [Sphaeramia orbicularis]
MADRLLIEQLCKASASGKLSEVLLLLQMGADVNGLNEYKRTALQVVMLGHTPLVEALLDAGADPTVRDPVLSLTVLHDAAREGFVDTVRVLADHRSVDVNAVDAKGNLPLHLAAREGHVDVVQLLIGRTADPRAPNGAGHTAGQLARCHRRTETAQFIDGFLRSPQ